MKKAFLQIFLSLLCLSAQAQKVSNILAEQRGQDIVVLYTLETSSPCEVSLLLSQDNGAKWGSPLKNVSGDVGKNISAGEKQIIWKVLEEREQLVGDKIKFKVVASGKKSNEPEMVFVEGGTFQMGCSSGYATEKPVHSVTLSSYNIGKYEVTQAQWKSMMGNNPSSFLGCDDCPVETVSWNEVQDFIRKLNSQTGKNFRLPTEAEWEFAAKGGNNSRGYVYSGSNNIDYVGWYSSNAWKKTHPVGTKDSNELGIYDMTGNVLEWCNDWLGNYNDYREINPRGIPQGQFRVVRGGSWYYKNKNCSVCSRDWLSPVSWDSDLGFRLVLPLDR